MSFDINKPYRTRDGREAFARQGSDDRFGGYIVDIDGRIFGANWLPNGHYCCTCTDQADLVNIPEKRTVKVWVNVYDAPDSCGRVGHAHASEALARRHFTKKPAACIEREITYEVGEGLEAAS